MGKPAPKKKPAPKAAPVPDTPVQEKPQRPLDNGDRLAFEALCALPRQYLVEAMLAAPLDTPEKERAKRAYVAMAEVAITAKAGRGWEEGRLDQLVDMQAQIDRHDAYMAQARDRWAAAVGQPVYAPIGAGLVEWLLGQLAEVEGDLREAMKTRPAFVRMSTPAVPPAIKPPAPKAQRHEVDLGPLNEAPPVEGRRRERPRAKG